jgi:hypothetical protein
MSQPTLKVLMTAIGAGETLPNAVDSSRACYEQRGSVIQDSVASASLAFQQLRCLRLSGEACAYD